MSEYLRGSIVERIEIDEHGIYIILNDNFYNIKLMINQDDIEQLPIDILCMGNYEPNEFAIVKYVWDLFRDKDEFCFLDIGANLGWYSLFADKMFKHSRVYSFEPAGITYERLNNNIRLNNSKIKSYNVGLYDHECNKEFYYDKHGSGASSLNNIREKDDITKESIQLITLDAWAKSNLVDDIDFIKLDIEGSELFAIKGSMGVIKSNHPIIFCEMLRKWSAKFGYNPNDIIQLLRGEGYSCCAIGKYSPGLRLCMRVDEQTEETNFLFLHDEKHKKIMEDLLKHEVWVYFH